MNGPKVFMVDEHEQYIKAKMRHNDDKECIAKSKWKLARTLAGVGRTSSKVVAPGGAAGSDAGSFF